MTELKGKLKDEKTKVFNVNKKLSVSQIFFQVI